jgi:hypothetical protein
VGEKENDSYKISPEDYSKGTITKHCEECNTDIVLGNFFPIFFKNPSQFGGARAAIVLWGMCGSCNSRFISILLSPIADYTLANLCGFQKVTQPTAQRCEKKVVVSDNKSKPRSVPKRAECRFKTDSRDRVFLHQLGIKVS